jgi:hypothetical protein
MYRNITSITSKKLGNYQELNFQLLTISLSTLREELFEKDYSNTLRESLCATPSMEKCSREFKARIEIARFKRMSIIKATIVSRKASKTSECVRTQKPANIPWPATATRPANL